MQVTEYQWEATLVPWRWQLFIGFSTFVIGFLVFGDKYWNRDEGDNLAHVFNPDCSNVRQRLALLQISLRFVWNSKIWF